MRTIKGCAGLRHFLRVEIPNRCQRVHFKEEGLGSHSQAFSAVTSTLLGAKSRKSYFRSAVAVSQPRAHRATLLAHAQLGRVLIFHLGSYRVCVIAMLNGGLLQASMRKQAPDHLCPRTPKVPVRFRAVNQNGALFVRQMLRKPSGVHSLAYS